MTAGVFDLLVIGGGINGAGIARDAAGRGLSVCLCEKGDLAEGTSSRSSKLIHGGLRYLEYYEFRLVREALKEREVLLAIAPHIIRPMRFVLPIASGGRPAWLVRLGLVLYDHLATRRRLLPTEKIILARDPRGSPIKPETKTAFAYSDCTVDDARLVVLNALDAKNRGAVIRPRMEVREARAVGDTWRVKLGGNGGAEEEIAARVLVNAAGPWVEGVRAQIEGARALRHARLVQGSHIVVRKFWVGEHAYILQNVDHRVVFVIPYERDLCLIGTTDIPFHGVPESVSMGAAERAYLLSAVARSMRVAPSESDIVWQYSGVRSLYDDAAKNPSAVTREYAFDLDAGAGRPALLSIFGGKITTYRKLAEHALERLSPYLPRAGGAWTARAPLPGGDISGGDLSLFEAELAGRHTSLPRPLLSHYARLYGTRARELLEDVENVAQLGLHFGGLLYEREARFLIETEWALTAADILTRRTKHHLHMSAAERDRFAEWLEHGY